MNLVSTFQSLILIKSMNNMGEQYRRYCYGVTEKGVREFLHTFLDNKGAEEYIEAHMKIFPGRYVEYQIGTPIELFDNIEEEI